MFKLIAFLAWVLFFVFAFKVVWGKVLKPYLDKEMKGGKTDGIQSKTDKQQSNK